MAKHKGHGNGDDAFAATSVYECYHIASEAADGYQEAMHLVSEDSLEWHLLKAKRDAAGLVARQIKYGHVENGRDPRNGKRR